MNTLKKYLITLGVGLLAVLMIIYLQGIFTQTEAVKVFHILCDGFFAVGFFMTSIGILMFTSNEGVFDGVVYSVKTFFSMFSKEARGKYRTYYDYKESRAKLPKLEFGYVIICGLIILVVSIVMYLFYLKYSR